MITSDNQIETNGNQVKTNDNHIKKLPVREYATLQNIGVTTTVYRYIRTGKREHEVIAGNTYVVFNDNHSHNDAPTNC